MTYPNELLRGIFHPTKIEDDYPTADVFHFDQNEGPTGLRWELSVNWRDDEGALESLFLQRKATDGAPQFKGGAAVLCRERLDWVRRQPIVKQRLSYERLPIPETNPYHGNLLLPISVTKPKMKMIAAQVALCVTDVLPNPHA